MDWEDELPILELEKARKQSKAADLIICLGTSLQIFPVAELPFLNKKRKSKKRKSNSESQSKEITNQMEDIKETNVVIVNLQPTPMDHKADLVINSKTDQVFERLLQLLNLNVPHYEAECDLIQKSKNCLIEY